MIRPPKRAAQDGPSADRSRGGSPLYLVGAAGVESSWSDALLVIGLKDGDRRAQRVVWDRYAPLVYRLSHRALGSGEDARDVTQDVFACLFCKIATLENPDALRHFIMSVTIRTLKHELRRRRLRRWVLSDTGDVPERAVLGADYVSRQLLRRFYGVLDALRARDRLVFVLRQVEGLTIEEVAETMDLSVATVKRSFAAASARVAFFVARDRELAAGLEHLGGNGG
jgi:RNA polymerase sigma-70 factor (ECF subfamily)